MAFIGSNKRGFSWLWIIVPILIIIALIGAFSDWIVRWLWLEKMNYEQVFWKIKETQFSLLIGALIISGTYLIANLRALASNIKEADLTSTPLENMQIDLATESTFKRIKTMFTVIGAGISILFSAAFFAQWDTYFRFHFRETVGKLDPVFQNDIGFYLFRLPFIELVQNSVSVLTFLLTLILIVVFIYSGLIRFSPDSGLTISPSARKQLSINFGIWLLSLSGGYFLDRYQLLFDAQGAVYGAGFTDIHYVLPALWILCIISLVLALVAFSHYRLHRPKWLISGAVVLVLVVLVGRNLLPSLVQSFQVDPSELQIEQPYLEDNISLTREAYKLDDIQAQSYTTNDTLTYADLQKNQPTVDNIRLWDPRLLINTYRQLQEIRSYYQFYSVDIGRYQTDKGYRQMMLASRELASDMSEQADTWVNRRLQYTHGYGLVMSPVTQESEGGNPDLVIKDLPPITKWGFEVNQPAIYYGSHQPGYRVVNTGVKELDYPSGDQNVYTNYEGKGGIPIENFFRKLLLAWELGDINILLSEYIDAQSRIQLWRPVKERVRQIAPFLEFEQKPYLVLSEGRMHWVLDAYTTSSRYPYSEPFQNSFNYIRNSVKVVVDAYHGTVDFYAMSDEEPILNVYREVFPDLFKPFSEMPEDLKKHIRYPQTMFEVQIDKYNRYHMTDPQVFYNNEDLWTRANEKYGGSTIQMESYYMLAQLPDEDRLQYMLVNPLTPANRDNMIAWMAAKSDQPNYGEVVVYKLPKERLIYGPAQIEAKIDQDTEISRQLSLWDQRGSSVIRGNLMIIPIENSFLYVEPVFLIAQGVDIPQLQRVIVSNGEKIAMEPTLQAALNVVFGKKKDLVMQQQAEQVAAPPKSLDRPMPEMEAIKNTWEEARTAMQNGNWNAFGQAMEELGQAIEKEYQKTK